LFSSYDGNEDFWLLGLSSFIHYHSILNLFVYIFSILYVWCSVPKFFRDELSSAQTCNADDRMTHSNIIWNFILHFIELDRLFTISCKINYNILELFLVFLQHLFIFFIVDWHDDILNFKFFFVLLIPFLPEVLKFWILLIFYKHFIPDIIRLELIYIDIEPVLLLFTHYKEDFIPQLIDFHQVFCTNLHSLDRWCADHYLLKGEDSSSYTLLRWERMSFQSLVALG